MTSSKVPQELSFISGPEAPHTPDPFPQGRFGSCHTLGLSRGTRDSCPLSHGRVCCIAGRLQGGLVAEINVRGLVADAQQVPAEGARRHRDRGNQREEKGFRGINGVSNSFFHSHFRWEVPIISLDDLRDLQLVRLFTKNTVVKIN